MAHEEQGPLARARRCIVRRFAVLAVAMMAGTLAAAAELHGRVEYVKELEVWIRMDGELVPKPGDAVDLRFTVPGGEQVSVGSWRVGAVKENLVWATVVEHTGRPAVGHIAVIEAPQPQRATMPEPTPPPQAPPPVAPPPSRQTPPTPTAASVDPELESQLKALAGADAVMARSAARWLYQHHRDSSRVQAAANETLVAGFDQRPRDDHHVDAMAYLCNILGESADRQYLSTLRAVAKTSPNAKLRKYATANLRKLE